MGRGPWRPTASLALMLLLAAVGAADAAGELEVRVVLAGPDGTAPGSDAAVWLADVPLGAPPSGGWPALEIRQEDKEFRPRVTLAPVGTTVSFPNYDRIFHNVFSLSPARPFDLGLYRNRRSKTVTFEHPGLVQIYCNIHPRMAASLVVVDSAHRALTDAAGRAVLAGVPPGRHVLAGWHLRAGEWQREVEVPAGGRTVVEVRLEAAPLEDQPHLNKHGKPYPPPDDDDFRY